MDALEELDLETDFIEGAVVEIDDFLEEEKIVYNDRSFSTRDTNRMPIVSRDKTRRMNNDYLSY